MKNPEKIGIISTWATIGIILLLIQNRVTLEEFRKYDAYTGMVIGSVVSLAIAYYFYKKHTPAQMIWNEKRKETMEEMLDLFEQLNRQVRVGVHMFEDAVNSLGYNPTTIQIFRVQNMTAFTKISQLRALIFSNTDRNYNYITNLEARRFKMTAETVVQYLEMQIRRPQNYLKDSEYLRNEHTIKRQLQIMFSEISSTKKDFLKDDVFNFRESDLAARWENTHMY